VVAYESSIHGKLHAEGSSDAPYCSDCHTPHKELKHENMDSPTFVKNIPALCGQCHADGGKAALRYNGTQKHIVENYQMSIHGKGLLASGLLVTATCVDCHTTHGELPASDSNSTVNPDRIAETCSNCHLGVYEEFKNSVHSRTVTTTDKHLPACSDCHKSHTIDRVDLSDFRQGIIDQCGRCHEAVTESYFNTFHGKVSKLGAANTAKCYDCHGSHSILPPSDPRSTLSRTNVVETCRQCHPNSNHKFVGYLTHATHHNRERYPYLYYTFWFMTTLLVGVFTFSGIHTLLWLPRAIRDKKDNAAAAEAAVASMKGHYYERFDAFSRFLHILVITSFLTLAVTGMTIKFADVPVFQFLSRMLGGPAVSGFVHRVAAIITFLYFGLHIGHLIKKMRREKRSVIQMLSGENTMMFRLEDLKEFIATLKWFVGIGPRPQYGRWTYWEKFDYFAVFWGVAVIGASGLLLWFSEFFTNLGVPGWLINVSTIIHSDEALLATGFIFTIHFFNTHFRPDKFPMDPVIFTGSVPLEELKYDRPKEYAQVIQSREIKDRMVAPPPRWLRRAARVFGFTALTIGLITVVLIIYAMLFAYR
jgi:cytochrome b subunit of formate dehydrogenase/nitrate/TMAO reductase-like tetraheme cytochrome c subunit